MFEKKTIVPCFPKTFLLQYTHPYYYVCVLLKFHSFFLILLILFFPFQKPKYLHRKTKLLYWGATHSSSKAHLFLQLGKKNNQKNVQFCKYVCTNLEENEQGEKKRNESADFMKTYCVLSLSTYFSFLLWFIFFLLRMELSLILLAFFPFPPILIYLWQITLYRHQKITLFHPPSTPLHILHTCLYYNYKR